MPGKAGEIGIFGSASKIRVVSSDGTNGENGKGGRGIAGDKIIVDCSRNGGSTEWKPYHDRNYRPEIKTGKDGENERDRVQPSPNIRIDDKAGVINNYKISLREAYGDRFKRHILTQFHNLLDGNEQIKCFYKTLDLANELKGLEDQLLKGELAKEDLIYFYDRLLSKIAEYVKQPNEGEKSDEYKKALSYLYTAGRLKFQFLRVVHLIGILFCSPEQKAQPANGFGFKPNHRYQRAPRSGRTRHERAQRSTERPRQGEGDGQQA